MITISKNAVERGEGCRRCKIIRLFIIASLLIVITGLVGGEHLQYLSFISAEGIAAAIWIFGGLLFIIKFLLWHVNKSKNKISDPGQI